MRFPLWLGGALVVLCLLNLAAAVSLLQPPEFAMVLAPSDIQADSGAAYASRVRLGGLIFKVENDRESSARSQLRLFEGRTELKPGHVLHAELREKGAGRFSHWGEWIYFSTSDNSDPRSNGRTYSVMATGVLDTNLLIALVVLDLISLAIVRIVLIRIYGRSVAHVVPADAAPMLSPLALAVLVTATAFAIAWLCGLTYRTNDDPDMRAIAEGLSIGRPSEFVFYLSVPAGLVLRALYGIAPQVSWYDLLIAGGTAAGAILLLTALLRLCRSRADAIFVALLGLIVLSALFQYLQFSAAAILLAGGAVTLLASFAFRPPVSQARLRIGIAAAALAFFCGSLIRFEGALLAGALVAPILLLSARQRIVALRMPLAGLAIGIVLAVSGRAVDMAWYRFTPGWENFHAEKSTRLRVSEYLHADISREAEMSAALAAVEWSRNDHDLITSWMFAVPDTFSTDRLSRFAELAPVKSWSARIVDLYESAASRRNVLGLFALMCVLALVMARSCFALAVVLVSAGWLAALLIALSIAFKAGFLHILWLLCGTISLVAIATALAGTVRPPRRGYQVIEDRIIAAAMFATMGCVALWQIVEMQASGRANADVHARLERDLAAWPITPDTIVVTWDADFPLERWVRPFHAVPPLRARFLHTTHFAMTPLADRFYAQWGSRDVPWSLCHAGRTYLVDGRRGYTERHETMLLAYMRERYAETVTLVPAFEGNATALLACRPATKGG